MTLSQDYHVKLITQATKEVNIRTCIWCSISPMFLISCTPQEEPIDRLSSHICSHNSQRHPLRRSSSSSRSILITSIRTLSSFPFVWSKQTVQLKRKKKSWWCKKTCTPSSLPLHHHYTHTESEMDPSMWLTCEENNSIKNISFPSTHVFDSHLLLHALYVLSLLVHQGREYAKWMRIDLNLAAPTSGTRSSLWYVTS
jgi:RNase P subunit RPR2